MESGYIKLSRDALQLLETDPDVFILMSQVALRAKWRKTPFEDGKTATGQAFIGDYKSIGLTEKRYRLAKNRAEHRYHLATFKGASKGTVVTLTSTVLYDINLPHEGRAKGGQKGEQRADKRTDSLHHISPIDTTPCAINFNPKERTENEQRADKRATNKEDISKDISIEKDIPKGISKKKTSRPFKSLKDPDLNDQQLAELQAQFSNLDVALMYASCCDHFAAKGERKCDWMATLRNWCRNQIKWSKEREEREKKYSLYPPKRVDNRPIPIGMEVKNEPRFVPARFMDFSNCT